MKKLFFLTLIWVIFNTIGFSQPTRKMFNISSISAESIFLDGGKADGLVIGDQLAIVRSKTTVVGKIEVLFVSKKSASCKILFSKSNILTSDVAVFLSTAEQKTNEPKNEPKKVEENPKQISKQNKPRQKSKKRGTKISGSASIQHYQLNDLTENGLNFSQPTLRINFRAKQLWGKAYQFRLRTRTRYNQRVRDFSDNAPKEAFHNRIYQLSFGYDSPKALFNFQTGRIISKEMSGVGYIDGLTITAKLSSILKFGLVGGSQPDLRKNTLSSDIRKYGGFLQFANGLESQNYWQSTLAFAGEYHTDALSREFFSIRNVFRQGQKLNIYQSLEVDLNRKWRKEKTGKNMTISNFFISSRYQFTKAFTAGLIFDNRQNYWTYQIKTLADSLFDDALRLGLRGNFSLRLPEKWRVYGNIGYRQQQALGEKTYSFSGGISKSQFLISRLSINTSVSGFRNPITEGLNFSGRMGLRLPKNNRWEISYGKYLYTVKSLNLFQSNEWVNTALYINFYRHLFASSQFEYAWGNNLKGTRILADFGYRF